MDKKPFVLKRLKPYLGSKSIFLYLSYITSAISSVFTTLPFVYLWLIIRTLLSNANAKYSDISSYVIIVIVTSILGILLYFLALVLSHIAAFRVEIQIQKDGINKVLNMPLGFFNDNDSGKIKKVINEGAATTHSFIAHQSPDLIATIVSPIVIIVISFSVNLVLGFVSLIPIFIGILLIGLLMGKNSAEFMNKYYTSLEHMSSHAVEYIRGIPVVKTFNQSIYSFNSFYKTIVSYKENVMLFSDLYKNGTSAYYVFVNSVAFFLIPATILFINGTNNALIISDFILYLIISPNLVSTVIRSMNFVQFFKLTNMALDKIDEITEYKNIEYTNKVDKLNSYDIEFNNVSFSYKNEKMILDNISFKLEQGKTIAIVGPSGSGKTTIARLIARFWDIESGEIKIGGVNIKDIKKEILMNNISFVFQNSALFSTTLRENILLGRNYSDEEILDVIDKTQSRDIINSLKDGLDTVIGSKGTYLSGGQIQRIALTRALLKDAPIILLDEATAFSDPENEKLIQNSLKEISKNKTTLMIAHRLTSIKDVSHIIVLDDKKIVEQGTHESLIANRRLYYKMYNEYISSIDWKIKDGGNHV